MTQQNTAFAEIRQHLEDLLNLGAVSPSGRPVSLFERSPPPRPDDQQHASERRQSEPFTVSDERTNDVQSLPSRGRRGRQNQRDAGNPGIYVDTGIRRPPVPPKPSPQTANSPPEPPPRTAPRRDGRAPAHRRNAQFAHQREHHPTSNVMPSLPQTTSTDAEDLKSMRWYHGNITKEAGIRLLSSNRYPKGSYLVRDSTAQKGNYVIMQKASDNEEPLDIINIRINCWTSPRGRTVYSREVNLTFPTMAELIDYYSVNLSQQSSFCILTSHVKRVHNVPDQVTAIGRSSSSSGSDSQESSDNHEIETENVFPSPTVTATTLIAIRDCVASYPTTLSFKVDDVMIIEERSDGSWSLAKNVKTGQEGYILANDGTLFVQNTI